MKKLLIFAVATALCAMSFACLSCKLEEEEKGWEGTKLVVSQWPENVTTVRLKADTSTFSLPLHNAGSMMASEYFSGNTVLTIEYDRLNDNEYGEYYGYGIRTDSQAPFKVFINGVEAENEVLSDKITLGNEEVEVNLITGSFKASFNVTGVKTVEVTFENAPEKILTKDIRLTDETIYAYIDTSALFENFKQVSVWEKPSSSSQMKELPRLGRNGLYVINKYTPDFYVDVTVKDNYYISDDDFAIDVPATVTFKDYDREDVGQIKVEFKSSGPAYVSAGTVIKLSGGKVTAYDVTNFAGKRLVFSECTPGSSVVNTASLSLAEDLVTERTFSLTIDGNDFSGTWKAVPALLDGRPCIKLTVDKTTGNYDSGLEFNLDYYDEQLNNTPAPNWLFDGRIGNLNYHFILKEAVE